MQSALEGFMQKQSKILTEARPFLLFSLEACFVALIP